MSSKNILSIAAFIVSFGISTVIANFFMPIPQILPVDYAVNEYRAYKPTSCFKYRHRSTTADAISTLIRQDASNGSDRKEIADFEDISVSDFAEYADTTLLYVDASSRIATDNLPKDFQKAWFEHLKAWRDYSNFLQRMKKSFALKTLDIQDLKDMDAYHSREINVSFEKVQRIGESYGADVR